MPPKQVKGFTPTQTDVNSSGLVPAVAKPPSRNEAADKLAKEAADKKSKADALALVSPSLPVVPNGSGFVPAVSSAVVPLVVMPGAPVPMPPSYEPSKFVGTKSGNPVLAGWNALVDSLSSMRFPPVKLTRMKNIVFRKFVAQEETKGTEFPYFQEDGEPLGITDALLWAGAFKTHGFALKYVLLPGTTLPVNDAYKFDSANARSTRRSNVGSDLGEVPDPAGGFGNVRKFNMAAKYEDPAVKRAEKIDSLTKVFTLDPANALISGCFLERMLNSVLSSYNCQRRMPNPFIKSGVNILLTTLALAADYHKTPSSAFVATPCSYLEVIYKDPRVCAFAIEALQTPVIGVGKQQISAARLDCFLGKMGLTHVIHDFYADNPCHVVQGPVASANLCLALNIVLYLCEAAEKTLTTTDSGKSTFMGQEYVAVKTAVDRTWSDYVITSRIASSAVSKEKYQYSMTAADIMSFVINSDRTDYEAPIGNTEPALYGFRVYIPNVKGRTAKLIVKLNTAMGATFEHQGAILLRHQYVINILQSIPSESVDDYLTFVTRSTQDSFINVLTILSAKA
jgi:hypothetical protein